MKEMQFKNAACRHCRFYEPEGRRGGSCQKLGVPVESNWKACKLASSPFESPLKKLEDMFQLNSSIEIISSRINAKKSDRPKMTAPKMASPKE